uniref:MYND-type domain-containing protein n=1 Tax=Alexandrium monilatum TaxID=311494 RepID=A0A7S4T691_9DINO
MRRKVEGCLKLPAGVANTMLSPYLRQRETDARHRLRCRLSFEAREAFGDQAHPPAFWVDRILRASGHDVDPLARHMGQRPLSWKDFEERVSAMQQQGAHVQLTEGFVIPADALPPGKCDHCGVPCVAECFCGEHYCSRKCQRQDWKNHRHICEIVFDNNSFGMIATQIEFTQFRRDVDIGCSMGTKPWPSSPSGRSPTAEGPVGRDDLSPGTRCVLEGLTSPAGAALNGLRGEVMGRAANSERLLVRLRDDDPPESWKKIQVCNLRRAGPPPPPTVLGAAAVLKQAGEGPRQEISGALRPLVAAYPDLTGPQYLHLLKSTGVFPELHAVRDAHKVRQAARAIKGPLVERQLDGALGRTQQMLKDVRDKPNWTGVTMSTGGGPRGVARRQSKCVDAIADWPDFFLQEGADVYGETLAWTDPPDSSPSPSGSAKPAAGVKLSKKAAQRQRREERAREAGETPAVGESCDGAAAASADNDPRAAAPAAAGPRHLDELYIWLIDAYRMRCHDDLQWRGGIRRGIYERGVRVERRLRPLSASGRLEREEICDLEEDDWGRRTNLEQPGCNAAHPTRLSVAKDFFIFCKLVEWRERYPPHFDFARLLSLAQKLLPKRFQKDHAKFKYGDENALSADRPSLRRFSESIYGCTIVQQHKRHSTADGMPRPDTGLSYTVVPHEYDLDHQYDGETVSLWEQVERYFEAAVELFGPDEEAESAATKEDPAFCDQVRMLFADVGGVAPWRRLYEELDLISDNFGLPHALAMDPHVPLGSTVMVKSLRSDKVLPSGCRPTDLNGGIGTLVKVGSQEPPRYEILTNGGSSLSVRADCAEVHVEKIGQMSLYGRMHLTMGGGSLLAADVGGYSSLSEEEAEDQPRLRDAAGKFRRRKGMERVGEARRMEECPAKRATYTEESVADEDEELQGCEIRLVGLQSAHELNGRRGRVVARGKPSEDSAGQPRFAVLLAPEPGEERRHVTVRRENLVFVDAHAEWEERVRAALSSKSPPAQEARIVPRTTARCASDPDSETPTGASKQKQRQAPAKEAPAKSAPAELSAAEQASLKAGIVEAVREASSQRCLPKAVEPRLRALLGEDAVLAAQRVAEASTKARGKKRAKRDRRSGLGPTAHWLARLWCFVLEEPGRHVDDLPRYSGKHRTFMIGPDDDSEDDGSEDEGECAEGEGSNDEDPAAAADACDAAALTHAMDGLTTAPAADAASMQPDVELAAGAERGAEPSAAEPAAAQHGPGSDTAAVAAVIGGQALATTADAGPPQPGAAPTAAERAGYLSSGSVGAVFSALSASEEGESSGFSEEEAGVARRPAKLPPPTSTLGFLEEDAGEANAQEPYPARHSAEAGPPSERWVHRFYGIVPGTVFVIPTRELYFTQDSISSEFKVSGAVGEDHSIRKMLTDIVGRSMRKRDIEIMPVVYHEGYYYSSANRRLATYLLAYMCGRCPRVKVQLVDKDAREVRWERRFTTRCHGVWILVRQSGERVGHTLADTDFRHPELDRARRRAGLA